MPLQGLDPELHSSSHQNMEEEGIASLPPGEDDNKDVEAGEQEDGDENTPPNQHNEDESQDGATEDHNFSRLLYACHIDKPDVLKRVLNGRHAAEEYCHIPEAILLCSSLGHFDCLQELIDKCCDHSNITDSDGNSPVILATVNKHYDVLQLLLTNGFNVNHQNNSGNCAVNLAVTSGDVTALGLLIRAKANLDLRDATFSTPIFTAAGSGNDVIMRMLLGAGCQVDISRFYGRIAFHRACESGWVRCIQVFLDHGYDANTADLEERTGLHMAAAMGHNDVVMLLLKAGCNPNAMDDQKITPLFECVERGHIDCVRTLIAAGGLTGIQNEYGNTLITTAALMGQVEVLHLLVKMVGDVNAHGYKKLTGLHCAALHGQFECTRILLEAGAHPNALAYDKATPMHLTIKGSKQVEAQLATLKHLTEYNADHELKMSVKFGKKRRKLSSFAFALAFGNLRIACWLAALGADLNLVRVWLTQNKWPPDVTKPKPDSSITWLVDYASEVRSLGELCRKAIRKGLGCGAVSDKVTQLPVPTMLQGFLLFTDLEYVQFASQPS